MAIAVFCAASVARGGIQEQKTDREEAVHEAERQKNPTLTEQNIRTNPAPISTLGSAG